MSLFSKTINESVISNLKETVVDRTLGAVINTAMFGANKRRLYFTDLVLPTDTTKSFSDIEMWIDPQSIGITKNNIINKTLTKNGFVIQHWGHDLTVVNVSAVSGFFGISKGMTDVVLKTIPDKQFRMGSPLSIFNKLKDFAYQSRYDPNKRHIGNPVITLIYEGNAYNGYFNNFNYNLVSASPFQISYNFSFTITEPDEDRMDVRKGKFWGGLSIASTIQNPAGTLSDITNATINSGTKWLNKKLNDAASKLPWKGLEKIFDTQPSRVTLY